MRAYRYVIIILVAAVVVIIWFFRPLPPSDIKGNLSSHAYMTGMVRTHYLWDRQIRELVSSIPDRKAPIPSIPSFLRPLVPPVAELYLLTGKSGGGRVVAVDLGWRSRLLRMMHGFIMGQIQHKGFGVIEGENIVRTPSGLKILVYQDAGTLFLAEGDEVIHGILEPPQAGDKGRVQAAGAGEDIAYLSFSNDDAEFTKVMEEMENDMGFLILPSSGSLRDGIIEIQYRGGGTFVVELTLHAKEGGDAEGIEGDINYLMELSDRFLSAHNFKTDRTINKDNNKLSGRLVIHPPGDK